MKKKIVIISAISLLLFLIVFSGVLIPQFARMGWLKSFSTGLMKLFPNSVLRISIESSLNSKNDNVSAVAFSEIMTFDRKVTRKYLQNTISDTKPGSFVYNRAIGNIKEYTHKYNSNVEDIEWIINLLKKERNQGNIYQLFLALFSYGEMMRAYLPKLDPIIFSQQGVYRNGIIANIITHVKPANLKYLQYCVDVINKADANEMTKELEYGEINRCLSEFAGVDFRYNAESINKWWNNYKGHTNALEGVATINGSPKKKVFCLLTTRSIAAGELLSADLLKQSELLLKGSTEEIIKKERELVLANDLETYLNERINRDVPENAIFKKAYLDGYGDWIRYKVIVAKQDIYPGAIMNVNLFEEEILEVERGSVDERTVNSDYILKDDIDEYIECQIKNKIEKGAYLLKGMINRKSKGNGTLVD